MATTKRVEDERTKQGGAPEVRGDRGEYDPGEEDRGESGLLSEDAAFEKFLEDEFTEAVLPTPPKLTGYHLVWLTTTSTYDSIQKRMRLGYTPVKMSEMPGFDARNGQPGIPGMEGNVTCNEMVLFKIPEDRYQKIMAHFHHKKPLQEEEGIVAKFDQQGERLKDAEDGVTAMEEEMRAKRKVPHFS